MITEEDKKTYQTLTIDALNELFFDVCREHNLDKIRYLLTSQELKERVDIHYKDDIGLRSARENIDIVKYLLTSPELTEHANVHVGGVGFSKDYILAHACMSNDLEMVDYLLTSPELKVRCFIDIENNTPLNLACQEGHIEIVKYLLTSPRLDMHAQINIDKSSSGSFSTEPPLVCACSRGHLEIVKYLLTSPELKEHANIHVKYNSALRTACQHNYVDIVKYLLTDPYLQDKHLTANIYDKNPGGYDVFMSMCKDFYNDDKIIKRWDVIYYLVMKYDLNYEVEKDFLLKHKNDKQIEMVHNLFNLRELNKKLDVEMPEKSSSNRLKI